LGKQMERLPDAHKQLAAKAFAARDANRFFHWELEFPEVFFAPSPGTTRKIERLEGAGFDAVIGNPPYVRQEGLGDLKTYLQAEFPQVYHGVADIYTYFYARGHGVLCGNGLFGMITSNKFIRSNYGGPLRSFLTGKAKVLDIVDFGELPLFDESATFPCIFRFCKGQFGQPPVFTQVKSLHFESLDDIVHASGNQLGADAFEGENWSLGSSQQINILRKMEIAGLSLKDYLNERNVKIRYGIKTGCNEAFVIGRAVRDELLKEDKGSAELIKPLIVGDDIRRYRVNFRERYLIWTYIGVPITKYPAILRHLKRYQVALETRCDRGPHWWELRACEYYDDFQKPKIHWPAFAIEPRAYLDAGEYWSLAPAYVFPIDDPYLLGVLLSKPAHFALKFLCSILGDADSRGRLILRTAYYERLPIPRATEEDRRTIEQLVTRRLLTDLAQRGSKLEADRQAPPTRGKARHELPAPEIAALDREIDKIVYRLYGLTNEEIMVVEGTGT